MIMLCNPECHPEKFPCSVCLAEKEREYWEKDNNGNKHHYGGKEKRDT